MNTINKEFKAKVEIINKLKGGVARMSDPEMIVGIQKAVSILVMAKARIGHVIEARVPEALGIDCIDESEVLTPADDAYHIFKHDFETPFVCGARNLGEAVRHIRQINEDIRRVLAATPMELMTIAKVSKGLGEAMRGQSIAQMEDREKMAGRGR